MTLKEVTTLRLVCKQFDEIIASKVLSSICLFRNSDNVLTNLLHLETLLSSKTVCSRTIKTLRISDWYWIHGSGYFVPWNEMPILGIFILLNALQMLGHLSRPFFLPHTVPRRVYKNTLRLYARLRLGALFKPRLNLPSVCRWNVRREPTWVFASTVRMLRGLPQLDELVLNVDEDLPNMGSFVRCLSKLTNLRKLKIKFDYDPGSVVTARSLAINKIGKIIAANPNLTHLELKQYNDGENIDLECMFSYIPKDHPLKLEHIGIHSTFRGFAAVIPHIHSLNSFHFSDSQYTRILLAAKIFPPVMSFGCVDAHTIEYLNHHPRITSLSFPDGDVKPEIFEIMARHSETLTEYGAYVESVYWCLSQIRYEMLFLRCTNLKRIVLHTTKYADADYEPNVTSEMAAALSVISRLESSPSMVFALFGYFKICLEYCHESDNPLLWDMAGRMLYDGPRQKKRS